MPKKMSHPSITFVICLLFCGALSMTGDAQRGGGPGGGTGPQITQSVGVPRFEYVGPQSAGRIAAAAAVAGGPGALS